MKYYETLKEELQAKKIKQFHILQLNDPRDVMSTIRFSVYYLDKESGLNIVWPKDAHNRKKSNR